MAKVYQDSRPRKHGGFRPWCISYVGLDGKRHRERTDATTKTEATAILRQRMSEITKARITGARSLETVKVPTFQEFVRDEYMPHCKATHTPATWVRDQSLAKAVLPSFGKKSLRAITAGDVQRFVDKRACQRSRYGKPIAPATVNREMHFLSGVFSEALRRNYLDKNPAKGIGKLPEHNDKTRWLTDAEEDRLLALSPEFLKPIILTALNSGMRLGEILKLEWSDVDFQQLLVRITHAKNHRTRYVPMNATLVSVLRSTPQFVGPEGVSPYVFVNPLTGSRYYDASHAFKRAAKRAGFRDVTFHTMRHTFASRLVQAGVPLKAVQELLGHGSVQVTMRYAHLAPSNLRDAVRVLDAARHESRSGTSAAQKPTRKPAPSQVLGG